jgi:hypothetical protein
MKRLALLLCFIAGVALAQTGARTPQVNDVFTYFGPTIGGDWGPPPGNAAGPIIPDNATLKTYATTQYTYVTRQSFSSTVYAPPLAYIASGSPCVLNAGAGDNGSQVLSADGKCWLARFPKGPTDAREWGTVADSGVTDNTAAINACLAYAATIQVECLLPGTPGNSWIKSGGIIVPPGLSATFADGGRTGLRGQGQNQTLIKSTVTGTNCAITYSFTYGVNGEGYTGGDFQIIGTDVGYGICTTGLTSGTFKDFMIQHFTIGLYALDTIRLHLENPTFVFNGQHIAAASASNSHPNQWVIINPKVSGSTNDGFIFTNAADIDIYGGDFESNNQSNNPGHATIFMNGAPSEGKKGLSIFGGYYSANGGDADFLFLQNNGENAGTHGIYGAEVQRSNATTFTTNNVRVVNNGTNLTTIALYGNSFGAFNTYVQSALRPDIGIGTPAHAVIVGAESNYFQPGVDAPGPLIVDNTVPATWTPVDASGAGLTFTSVSAVYTRKNNVITASFSLTFPTTASATPILIGGLPVPVPTPYGSSVNVLSCSGTALLLVGIAQVGSSNFSIATSSAGSAVQNTTLQNLIVRGTIIYPAS